MNSLELNSSEYNAYYKPYITALGNCYLMASLKEGLNSFVDFIELIPDQKLSYAYGEGKWTIAEVLIHLIDTERIFQYRALRFARFDKTPVKGFDQDDYVPNSRANLRVKNDISKEYHIVRASTIALFNSFNEEELLNIGIASGSEMSVRALGFIMCGHVAHHKRIIAERYL